VVQTETRQPIYTSDLNDPRLRAYNDSLSLYKGYRNYDLDKTKPIEVYDKNDMATLRAMYPNTKLIEKKAQPLNSYDQWVLTQRGRKTNFKVGKTYSNKELALEQNKTEQYENKQGSPFTKNKGNLILDRSNRAIRSTTIAPIGMGYGHMEDVDNSNAGLVTIYKKPVQPVIYKKAINPKQKLVMGFQKFDDLDLPEQIQFKDLPQPRGGYKTAAPTPQMISETPTKYSYTYPSGNEQKTIYFPSKSTWKAFVDQYDGLNTTEQAGSFSATPGVYTRERRPNPVFKNIEYQIGGNLPKAQTGIEEPLTKPSVDWFKQWYQQRQTLPQFSRVAGKRLNLLSAPPKVELTPVEDLQKFGAIAEYKRVRSADPSQDVLSLADPATIPAYAERLQKERGKPFLRPVDLNLGTDPSVVGHEMSHWLDARAPQSTMLPIGANRSEPFQRYPIFEAANFKESGLDLPTYRWISNSRLTSIPGVKTEFNSVLNELRQREGLRGDQPTTPEQMKDIMDKYINLPEEKLYNQTTEGSQNDRIRTLIKYLQQDPVKLSELNNRIVGISKKGAPVAKNGGWLTEYKNGGQHGGLDRWFAEKWVDIKTGKTCGRQEGESRGYPACRPSKRVSSKTPKTSSELSSEERAKFKSSKTSSQRIPYSHKRRK
jgi:hypothetical protein